MRYLLLAGLYYYPRSYTQDWVGLFESKAEAYEFYSERKSQYSWDWHEIVDLHHIEKYINTD